MNNRQKELVELVSSNILKLHYRGEFEDEDGNLNNELVDEYFDENFEDWSLKRLKEDVILNLSSKWKEVTFIDRSI